MNVVSVARKARVLALLPCLAALVAAAPADARTRPLAPGERQALRAAFKHSITERSAARREARRRKPSIRAAAATGLPTRWCGSPTGTDLADPPEQAGRPAIKVIYAHPADIPNRFGYFADVLQSNASQMAAFVAQQSGRRSTIRFDLGTSCGGSYLDIQTISLKRPRSEYLHTDAANPSVRYPYAGQRDLYDEVQAAIAGQTPYTTEYRAPVRNFLLFIDGMNIQLNQRPDGSWAKSGNDWDWGSAATYIDDSPDPYEQQNVNPYGSVATMFGSDPDVLPGGRPVSDPAQGFMPQQALHEVFHTLGAVQNSAPNATGGLHCNDGFDLMCYADSPDPKSVQRNACEPLTYPFSGALDCNGDDYFNPSPAPGSYLATHWNTYSSPFLAPCTERPDSCNASGSASGGPGFDTGRANEAWRRRLAPGQDGKVPTPPTARRKPTIHLAATRHRRYWSVRARVRGEGRARLELRCRPPGRSTTRRMLYRKVKLPVTVRARLKCASRLRAAVRF